MAKAEEKEKVAGKAEHGSHEVAALRGLLRCLTCDGVPEASSDNDLLGEIRLVVSPYILKHA